MTRRRLLAASSTLIALALPGAAQCPIQALSAPVPDRGHFGRDLALSGSRLLVGSEREQAAFLFEDAGSGWLPVARLRSPLGNQAVRFGVTVALSGDTAVVADTQGPGRGRVHVYRRSAGDWDLEATLLPADGEPGDFFGAAIAIDGDTVVARKSVGFEWAVHVFERSAGAWTEVAKLTRPGIRFFGMSLALRGDDLLVGDPGDSADGFNAGAAFFYLRQGAGWMATEKVRPSVAFSDAMFGSAVDIEGDVAVVGAPAFFRGDRRGAGHVFERMGGDWVQTQSLFAEDVSLETYVASDVSIEGDRIVLGDRGDDAGAPGAAYVFERTAGVWLQTAKLRRPAGGAPSAGFGQAVEQRGAQLFVGSPNEGPGLERGRVHVFDLGLAPTVRYCQSTPNSTGEAARIDSIGSHLVPANDVTLIARGVPDQPGFFLLGPQATQRPLGDGFLCIGAPAARLALAQAEGGDLVHHMDFAAQPFSIAAGSTWNFQAWFLDPEAQGSGVNLSDAIAVTFCP